MKAVCDDSYDRLLEPSMERELRTALTDTANEQAIHNFALNLRPLLMQPPVKGAVTMGLDPGYSHGCKVAVVDETGKVLDTTVVYPTFGEKQKQDAITKLSQLIKKDNVRHLAIGNGTASRETEAMAVEMIRRLGGGVSYMIVNEAGASVYSASKLAAEEFPQYDVNLRSRRVDRAAAAGPAGRAGQDRPEGHRRRPVSARHAGEGARRGARRRGRGVRQRRRRGPQYGFRSAAAAGRGPERDDSQKHRRLP